jgi:YD repeat-containing protein
VYNSRDGDQPANFTFSNVSPLWTHTWQAYIEDDPNAPGSNVTRVASGGGGYDYATRASLGSSSYSTSTGGFTPEVYDNAQLFRLPPTGTAISYERDMPDGSKEVYGLSNGATTTPRLMFLTQVIDPAGNTTTLNYDSQFRLTSVTDAMGRNTTFTYGLSSNDLLITQITDAFGRFSQLTYDTMLRLSSITDPIGITSSFTYGSTSEDNFVTQLATPYGTSKFSDIPNPNDPILRNNPPLIDRSLAITDPLGNVELLYLYQNINQTGTQTTESSLPSGMTTDNGFLEWRNTYYWNRHAAADGGVTTDSNGNPTAENFANPVIYHWFHQCCTINYVSNQIGSVKMPLENFRQWTNYPNQSVDYYSGTLIKPTFTGRVLDDGTTQLSSLDPA